MMIAVTVRSLRRKRQRTGREKEQKAVVEEDVSVLLPLVLFALEGMVERCLPSSSTPCHKPTEQDHSHRGRNGAPKGA